MENKENLIISMVFIFITLFLISDLYFDFNAGVQNFHIESQSVAALISLSGLLFVWKKTLFMEHRLLFKREELKHISTKYKEMCLGLSSAIDRQFIDWQLSDSEKEIGYLLLKGFSLKEIAQLRTSAEITIRQQCAKIYEKASLNGRAELSAFFIEDYLSTADLLKKKTSPRHIDLN